MSVALSACNVVQLCISCSQGWYTGLKVAPAIPSRQLPISSYLPLQTLLL